MKYLFILYHISKFIVSTKRTFNWTEKIFGTFFSKVLQKITYNTLQKKVEKKCFDVTKIWRSKGPIRHFQISFYVTFRAQSFTSLNADLHQETSIERREKLYLFKFLIWVNCTIMSKLSNLWRNISLWYLMLCDESRFMDLKGNLPSKK